LRSEFRSDARQPFEICADEAQGLSQLENESSVNDILAGRAPVNESRGFPAVFRDERGELLNEWNRQISGKGGSVRELLEIYVFRAAFFFDGNGGRGGNHAGARFRTGESGFKFEHALHASGVGKDFIQRLPTK
jgi:hypothetical protein